MTVTLHTFPAARIVRLADTPRMSAVPTEKSIREDIGEGERIV